VSSVRRSLLAALLAGAAVVLLLLALDVRRVEATFRTDDLAFRGSASQSLWRPAQALPFGVTARVLGTGDDVAFRRGVQDFRLAHPREAGVFEPELESLRGRAQVALTRVARSALDGPRRAAAVNLLGVLAFTDSAADSSTRGSYLADGVAAFQAAAALDPLNDDVKYNLELALSRLRDDPGTGTSAGGRRRGSVGGGAGGGEVGSGY
jgi:hypothetical protein